MNGREIFMKKNLLAIFCCYFAILSCEMNLSPEQNDIYKSKEISIEAFVEDNDLGTRTALDGTSNAVIRNILWNMSDSIAITSIGTEAYAKMINTIGIDLSDHAIFTGEIQLSEDYIAFYPYSKSLSFSLTQMSFTLPAIQTYAPDNFSTGSFPMIAKLVNEKLLFKNLCGLLELNLIGTGTVSSISFRGYDNYGNPMPVAGVAKVIYDYSDNPSMEMLSDNINTVSLNCCNPVTLSDTNPTPFHLILPPGVYHNFEVKIHLTDGRTMVKVGTTPITIKRSERTKASPLRFTETPQEIIDLNVNGETANSYIISEPGTYKFKAVKGNSSILLSTIASVDVMWESFGTSETPNIGDLIRMSSYSDGYITFKVTNYMKGNAVIAAKNSSGNILWSWHIWLTDKPESQIYYNGAGTMMDRNLGATSATPGDVGALGLIYQWGRKDPFLSSSSINRAIEAQSTCEWPAAVETSATVGTVEYSILNPMTFITTSVSFDTDSDWHFSSRNNSLWSVNKSVYDPCPIGWQVPTLVWYQALGGYKEGYLYDRENFGINFSGGLGYDTMIWYPDAWGRFRSDGKLTFFGQYWSVITDDARIKGLHFNQLGEVYPRDNLSVRASGAPVRCMRK